MQGNMEERGWLSSEFLSEDEMRRATAQRLGVPFVLLSHGDILPEALVLIPEPLARAYGAVAYNIGGGVVEVVLLDIADLDKVSPVISSLHTDKKIKPRLTNQASIKQALVLYQKYLKETFGKALQGGDADALILHALLSQASDIHLDVQPGGTRIRYRIQGALHEAVRVSAEAGNMLVRSVKQLANLFPIPVIQEGKFKLERDGEAVHVGVANLPGVEGERLTMRLARERVGSQGFTLSALGLHGKGLEQMHTMLHARSGLILVCGPEGSGKTTTLYTLLDQLGTVERSVATIEESIEHKLLHASQTQTRPDVGLTMLTGLRAVLRTDPDVVLVGNIDSAEVAQLALEAAARGVLVLAAIDAKSAAGAIEKLISFDISPRLIASQLLGVVGLRLAPKLAPDAKGAGGRLSRDEAAMLEEYANFGRVLAALKEEGHVHEHTAWKDVPFYKGGEHRGWIGLQEVLTITSAIKELILQKEDKEALAYAARQEGMLTLLEDALCKAVQGLVSVEDVLDVAGE